MTRTAITLLATIASALAWTSAPAIAQDKNDPYADNYYDDEITIIAPRVYRERTGERDPSTGAPIEYLERQRIISTADLDLRYDGDVRELHRRINVVAREACNEIERSGSGVMITSERQCIRRATREAMAEAAALVYYRRG